MQLQSIYRVTVFVPQSALRNLLDGIKQVYPLGDACYDSVLWYVGEACEEFRPLPGSSPAHGSIGELHREAVNMVVFSIPRERALLDRILEEGVREHHPWESPGIFIEESWLPSYQDEIAHATST
ncbi:MAG: hypothetical protein KY410_03940 [Proteobacteria bacterium]|nr:hypothetical protein [Pseudomonadota bacterium]